MRYALLAIVLAISTATTAMARQVEIIPSHDSGATMVYRLSAMSSLEQSGERTVVRQDATLALRISDELIRDIRLIDVRLLDVSIEIEQDDGSVELRASREGGEMTIDHNEAPDEIVAIARALIDAAVRLGMTPDGRIVGVQGLASAATIADESPDTAGVALGVFYAEAVAGALEPIFFADDVGAEARTPGDAWTVEFDRPLGEGRTIRESLECVFDSTGTGDLTWAGDLITTVEQGDDLGVTSARVEVGEQRGRVEAEWNADAAALQRRVRTLATDLIWRLGNLEVMQRQETTITLERLDLAEPLPDDLFTPPDQAPDRRSTTPGG